MGAFDVVKSTAFLVAAAFVNGGNVTTGFCVALRVVGL
jgi:hypothetical protein